MPALWTGLGDLVESMVERNPTEALSIARVAATQSGPETSVALKSLWDAPPDAAGAHSRLAVRTLDTGGRLSLPVVCDGVAQLAARRAQTVLTVYLPGSTTQPSGRATASVGLRGGRLTLGKALRAQLGIADRADVLVLHDPEALTLTLTAASRLDTLVGDTLTALANGAHAPFTDEPLADEHSPAEDQQADKVSGHLRLVGTQPSRTARTGELA